MRLAVTASLLPSPSSSLLNTRSIVKKRLLLAKSTYESDVLVLDDNPPTSSNGNVPLCINVGHIKEEDVITKTMRRRGGLTIEKRKEKKQNKRGFLKKLFRGGGGGEKQNYNNDNNNNFDKVFPVSSSSNKQSSADNSSQKNPNKTTSVETDTVIDEEPSFSDLSLIHI